MNDVIIDGVDVTKCPFFQRPNWCDNYYATKEGCKEQKCIFKNYQLAKKECEHLKYTNEFKNELLIKLGCPTTATAKRKVYILEEYIKQLNETIEKLMFDKEDDIHITKEEFEEYQELKQQKEKHEELMEEMKTLYNKFYGNKLI